jgi:hypothetical protein
LIKFASAEALENSWVQENQNVQHASPFFIGTPRDAALGGQTAAAQGPDRSESNPLNTNGQQTRL